MTEYKIKVIKQRRILASIFIVAILFPLCILISAKLETGIFKITIPLLIISSVLTLLYYYSFGQVIVTLQDRELSFNWERKPIFNFKAHKSIMLEDISRIIVNQGTHLSQIETEKYKIELGGVKSKNPDLFKLLKLLKSELSIKPMDSWDVLKERGWLNIAYKINLVVLIIIIGIVIAYIILLGFNSKLLFMPIVLSQLVFSHFLLKNKLNK